jgi:catechol 2,3-dioxygenase-like lactoylglutathione lyase family enzyme
MAQPAREGHAAGVRIVGLDHVQIAVPTGGLERARAFYAGVLGFAEDARPPGRSPGMWLRAPATILHLGVEDPFTPARKAHAAFLVEDLEAARAELVVAECEVHAAEGARLHAFDPFGNRIELVQAGEGFSER